MRRYGSNKEDLSIPVDGVSAGDVEKDIEDIQSYIDSLKSADDRGFEDRDARKEFPSSKSRRRKPYLGEGFGPMHEKDDILMDFPQSNNQVEDIRDTLIQDYIKNLASMKADEVLESSILSNRNKVERRKQINLSDDNRHLEFLPRLPYDTRHLEYPRRLPDDIQHLKFPRRLPDGTRHLEFPRRLLPYDTRHLEFPRRLPGDTRHLEFPRRLPYDTRQLPYDPRHLEFLRRLPDIAAAFEYPEHIVERSDNNVHYHSTKYVTASSKQGHAAHSASVAGGKHRNTNIDAQHQRNLELPTTKNENVTTVLTEKKTANTREDPTLKMSHKHVNKMKSGNRMSRKRPKSKLAGVTVLPGKDIQEQIGDKNHTLRIHDVKEIHNDKQMSRTHYRQNSVSAVTRLAHKTEIARDTDTSTIGTENEPKEHRNTVSIEKRRGRMSHNRQKTNKARPKPRPTPPQNKPWQADTTVTRTTVTDETVPTTVTTESSTWTTQTQASRTMQEIIDSGVDKIDMPLSGPPTWHAFIHGHRDIVLAGAIMGGIGLLLILLSFVYMFINKRHSQKKTVATANKNTNKRYQRFGSAEETIRLTEPQHSLFNLSSDEETTEESDEDSGQHRTLTKGTVRRDT